MSRKQQKVFWPSLAIVVLILITLGFVAARSKTTFARATIVVPPQSISADQNESQGLVIAIRPTGFMPAEIEVTEGRYLLIVQNRVGIRDLAFQFDREAGGKLHQVHDQKLQWKKAFDLHPGTYMISVVDYPKWRCVIKVKPR